MINLTSKDDTEKIINLAERTYKECFCMLLAFKDSEGDISNTITNFQPRLAEILYDLMSFYQKLKSEARQLISEKKNYPPTHFKTAIAENSQCAKMIKETIKIGKSLGDAFAWLFYQGNLPELLKHFEHQSTGLHVGGIGGKGELEFIKHSQNLNGLFVIYHGITSILRIGDFSLYATGHGIVSIGELKTEPTEHGMKINAYISSKVKIHNTRDIGEQHNMSIGKLVSMPKEFPNLKQQLAVQDQLLFHQKSSEKVSQATTYDYQLINQLCVKNDIIFNEDKSLMLIGFPSSEKGLFQILSTLRKDSPLPDGLTTAAEKLIVPESTNNRFIIGEINTEPSYLRIPPFWWHIDNTICEKIYFKQLHIFTVFNPSHLIQHMEDNNFHIIDSKNMREINLIKIANKHKSEFHNFEILFDLISYSLMKPTYVLELVDNFIAGIEKGKYPPNSKIEMIIQQSIFPPLTKS